VAWCGQVSDSSPSDIHDLLNLMSELENDYPGVKFVYMTATWTDRRQRQSESAQ